MFTYTNNAGYVFRDTRKNMTELLRSGAGQILTGLKDRDDWNIETISKETTITVNLVHNQTGEVIDTATAELMK